LNENEDYFRITKSGNTHILSDRISFKWTEVVVLPIIVFLPLFYLIGWFPGLVAGVLVGIGYALYRLASSLKYTELHIDENSGIVFQLKKYKDKVSEKVLITEKYDPLNVVFNELTRSGKTKYLMTYKTHKENDLLILKNKRDKEIVEDYLRNKIEVYNNVHETHLKSSKSE